MINRKKYRGGVIDCMSNSNKATKEDKMEYYISLVNSELDLIYSRLAETMNEEKIITDAMRYSISAGGKRIRPVLVLEFCRICGGNAENAVSAACAIEMIHTFSLIHDDLPCMDNDDFRRGRPSCHKAYNESLALLAGDALENMAYKIIADDDRINDSIKVKLIRVLTKATEDMIKGQVIDTENEGKMMSESLLLRMYDMKTAALLKAACVMGCICAEAGETQIDAAYRYAFDLGTAFQIIDDILDIVGTDEDLGKPTGSDAENGKITFASLNGVEKSKSYAAELTGNALKELDIFDDNLFLKELTQQLLKRNK